MKLVCQNFVGCQNFDCKQNIFWKELKLKRPKETELAKYFKNCMLNIDREMTLEEIGQMWGITRERVRQIEERAILKLYKRLNNQNHPIRDYL